MYRHQGEMTDGVARKLEMVDDSKADKCPCIFRVSSNDWGEHWKDINHHQAVRWARDSRMLSSLIGYRGNRADLGSTLFTNPVFAEFSTENDEKCAGSINKIAYQSP